jgi:hypothetical protein
MPTATLRAALTASAMALPCAAALAQDAGRGAPPPLVTPAEAARLSDACRDLAAAGAALRDPTRRAEIGRIVRRDNADGCAVAAQTLAQGGGATGAAGAAPATGEVQATEPVRERATIETEVTIEREAVVEGEVIVRQGPAAVAVQPAPPEIAVAPGAPQVTVRERPATIVVRQQPAEVTVDMPQPTVRIRVPAPEIFVERPAPEVEVAAAEPAVEVRQAEPSVEVTVPEPEVDVNVAARIVDPDAPAAAAEGLGAGSLAGVTPRIEPAEGEAEVRVAEARPVVTVGDAAAEPEIAVERARPQVRFEAAEPRVTVRGEPKVEIEHVGEPRVVFETAEEREARRAREAAGGDRVAAATPAPRPGAGAAAGEATVSEILALDIVDAQGRDLGDADRVVRNGEGVFIVLEHGGFLGLGAEQVALSLRNAELRDGRLVLSGISPEELERMPAYDPARERRLSDDDRVTVGR